MANRAEDYIIYRVLDNTSRNIFDKLYMRFILVFLGMSLLTYFLFLTLPVLWFVLLFENKFVNTLVQLIPLDHSHFIEAGNSFDAARIWSTEITILFWLFLILILIGAMSLRMTLLDRLVFEKLGREPLMQRGFISGIAAILFLVFYPWMGISRKLIVGEYRGSFGPNDLAILWFVALAFIAVAAFWMVCFFLVSMVSKINNLRKIP